MLKKRINRLEGRAPAPITGSGNDDREAIRVLDRVASLKWLSGTRQLTADEQREYAGLWQALRGSPC